MARNFRSADLDPKDSEVLRLEEQLQIRDDQVHLAEGAGIGMWDIDIASDTVRANAQYFQTLGLKPTDEAVPMSVVRALRVEGDRQKVVEGFAEMISGGASFYENEFRIRRPDGQIRWIFGRGLVVRDAQGTPIRFRGIDIDITDQKRAAEAAQRLAAIVESSQDAIISKELDGTVTSWNPAAEHMFGYSAEEMIGRSIMTIIPENRQHEEAMILSRISIGERVESFDTIRRHKSGRLLEVALTVSPIRLPNGQIVGASKIARDITSRKDAERRINALMGELTHRVKNQYAVILSMVRESARHAATASEFERIVRERIIALARSHDLLINGKWVGATLRDLVLAQLEAFAAPDMLDVEGPSIVLAPTAVQYLGMAFHELATNATKYGALANTNGRIEVRWQLGFGDDPRLQLIWREFDGNPRQGSSRGFGSTVLERVAPAAVNGSGTLAFDENGLFWTLEAPMSALEATEADQLVG